MGQIAVIGANGFIGKALMQRFCAEGHSCVAVGHDTPLPGARLDAVVDCNGEGRRFWCNENPEGSYQRNVEAVRTRLSTLNASTYVYISTVDVYGEGRAAPATSGEDVTIPEAALDTYGLHKHQAERLVLETAQCALVLRCATVIGPGLKKNPVFDMLHDAPLRMTPDSTLNLIRLRTIGTALLHLMNARASGVYNIAASAAVSVTDIREIIAAHRGISPDSIPEHAEKITTRYDVDVVKISAMMQMPTSKEALKAFLEDDDLF